MTVGLCITLSGLAVTFAFGVFAFVGIPIAIVGLGVFSAGYGEV
jgi:hypothetical protein